MPVFDIDSHQPHGSYDPDPSDGWSVPLGRVAGIRFFLSYSVIVALAILAALVAMVVGQNNNADLPLLATTAVAIWSTGWLVQLIVQLGMHYFTAAKSESITIGVVGVELPNPLYLQNVWSAPATLVNAMITLSSLLIFGFGFLCLHLTALSADLSIWASWRDALATPSVSLGELQNVYLTAAWLFWIQAASQAFPVPRHLGRGGMAAVIGMFAAEAEENLQVKLLRKSIQLTAVITIVIAMATMITDGGSGLPRWAVLFVLAIWLWISSRSSDLVDWVAALNLAYFAPTTPLNPAGSEDEMTSEEPSGISFPGVELLTDLTDSIRLRKKRQLAKAALLREREEASDAARLDAVLQTVSEHGTDGLSDSDKALLRRVSENLRKQRDKESE